MVVTELNLSHLKPDPQQPRKSMDEEFLENLGRSIAAKGQLQPVICFKAKDSYVIVEGHCRVAALKRINQPTVKAIVLEERPPESELLELQLTANCVRQDLKPLEKAEAYERLRTTKGLNVTELARTLSVSKGTVTQTLSYLRLPQDAKDLLNSGKLSGSAAYAIIREPDKKLQSRLLSQARAGGLTRAKASRERGTAVERPSIKRTTLRIGEASITIAAGDRPDFDAMIDLCGRVIKECRRASRDGLDVSTFERVLADRHRSSAKLDESTDGELA